MILLTLFGGMFFLRGGPTSSGLPDKTELQVKAEGGNTNLSSLPPVQKREDRLRRPIRDFLGLAAQSEAAHQDLELKFKLPGLSIDASARVQSGEEAANRKEWQEKLLKGLRDGVGKFECMIVTVADPVESQSSYRFDLQIETLHRALVASEEYLPDAFYLPWDHTTKDNRQRTEPGVLLYRRTQNTSKAGKPDLLAVYLVGELPTTGVHQEAFAAAIGELTSLMKANSQKRYVRICGPTFSGSGDSLAKAIRSAGAQFKNEKFQWSVLCGSAVGIDRDKFLELAGGKEGKTQITFRATVHSGQSLENALIQYVKNRTLFKSNVRIAWLREAGTGYGISSAPSRKLGEGEIIDFPVPLNIARVRSTYESERNQERSEKAKSLPDRFRLPIPFDDVGATNDLPPVQTPTMTAAAEEVILGQILSTIRNEGIQYIGVAMTDVRDPIFLSELVAEQCPNAQLLLVISDLLDLHTEFRSSSAGALVVSTHSLCAEEQDWCFPFLGRSQKLVLSQQSNYGLYNAVVLLRYMQRYENELADADEKITVQLSAQNQPDIPHLVGYGQPFQSIEAGKEQTFQPPVWISLISPTGIWPLEALLAADEGSSYTVSVAVPALKPDQLPAAAPFFNRRISPSSQLVMWLWIIFGTIYLVGSSGRMQNNWSKPLDVWLSGEFPNWMEHWRTVFRLMMGLSFCAIIGMEYALAGVAFVPLRGVRGDQWSLFVFLLFLGALIATLVLAAQTASEMCRLSIVVANWIRRAWRMRVRIWRRFLRIQPRIRFNPAVFVMIRSAMGIMFASSSHRRSKCKKRFIGSSRLMRGTSISPRLMDFFNPSIRRISRCVSALLVVGIFVVISLQRENARFWYLAWTDLWNGISLLFTSQLLAAAMIILAYGFLLQFHMTIGNNLIRRPSRPRADDAAADREDRSELATRLTLIFPIARRWGQNDAVHISILCGVLGFVWLLVLGMQTMWTQYFVVIILAAFLLTCGLWWWRFVKAIVMTNDFLRFLEHASSKWLGAARPHAKWRAVFKRNRSDEFKSLGSLLLTSRPGMNDSQLEQCNKQLVTIVQLSPRAKDVKICREDVCAQETILYVRQFFAHTTRLLIGLGVSGMLLFFAANSYPFNSGPLMQLTTSFMLLSIGLALIWYYLKFDRDVIVSLMVGSRPGHVEWNWSLVLTVVPAATLAIIALLSQAFPEMWHSLRDWLQPMINTSG